MTRMDSQLLDEKPAYLSHTAGSSAGGRRRRSAGLSIFSSKGYLLPAIALIFFIKRHKHYYSRGHNDERNAQCERLISHDKPAYQQPQHYYARQSEPLVTCHRLNVSRFSRKSLERVGQLGDLGLGVGEFLALPFDNGGRSLGHEPLVRNGPPAGKQRQRREDQHRDECLLRIDPVGEPRPEEERHQRAHATQ